MESADLEPSAFDSSIHTALPLNLTMESGAKLQELLAVKQFAAPGLEEGQPGDSNSSNGTNESGDSSVVATSKYLELLEERRPLEEEQACLKRLEELIKAKEMTDRDNQKSAEKQVLTERARAFTW